MKLSEIKDGENVKIVALGNSGRIAEKLKNLGIAVGATVKVMRRAPFGTTTEIRSGNTCVAIGRNETDKIAVEYV